MEYTKGLLGPLRRLFDALLLCAPIYVVFLDIPVSVYSINQGDLSHLKTLTLPFFTVFVFFFLVSLWACRKCPPQWLKYSFFVGVYFIAQDYIFTSEFESAVDTAQKVIPSPTLDQVIS